MALTYDIDSLDNRDPALIRRLHRLLYWPLKRYFRAEVRGVERIPPGRGLYVANHSSGILTPDSFIFGGAVYEQRGLQDLPYGLGHEVAISAPVVNQIIVPLGAVRASHVNASRLFARDKKVIVYPGGDLDAMRPFRHRHRVVFGPRRGYIRLALREGVPVLPVVSSGSHATFLIVDDLRWLARLIRAPRLFRTEVWPLTLSIPWGFTLGPLPAYIPWPVRIVIEVLDPIRFPRTGPDAAADDDYVEQCAARVEGAMQETLSRLAAE
jgi:1-acyl-sn-glycerol-3-phosphate acyltransferase